MRNVPWEIFISNFSKSTLIGLSHLKLRMILLGVHLYVMRAKVGHYSKPKREEKYLVLMSMSSRERSTMKKIQLFVLFMPFH